MEIKFYTKLGKRQPVIEFIQKLDSKDRAKVLACLKSVEELSFESPRVQFRQIKGRLWEIKIRAANGGYRFFYVTLDGNAIIILHAYKKKSQKAPRKDIELAEKRMLEVIHHEINIA